jgi:hypothetical protein
MEKYIFDLIAFLAGTALVGLVALLINGLKSDLAEIKTMLKCAVMEPICKERRETMERDINNIAEIVRTK